VNPYDPVSPVSISLVEIAQQWYFKGWRQYYHSDPDQGQFVSNWISLEAGKFYKLRAQHRDMGGGMFATISVEYRNGDQTFENHPMAGKAV
jgi:hypothetical protein